HALVAETFPKSWRGRAGAILQTGAPVGVALALLVGWWIAPAVHGWLGFAGWRICYMGASATALLAFVVRRGCPESDLWERGGTRRCGEGLRSVLAGAFARRFWLALLFTTTNGFSYWCTYSWLPQQLKKKGAPREFMVVLVIGELLGYAGIG